MGLWRKGVIKQLLLILFLGYYVSVTFFPHVHIENGVAVVHSHPYNPFSKENPTKQQHSKSEYTLIAHLDHFLTFISLSFLASITIKEFCTVLLFINESIFHAHAFLFSNGLRAPPRY